MSKGEFLFKEGQTGDAMYIITSGNLEVFKENRVIAHRTAGEYLGEMALLGNKIRSASVRAITDVKTIEIHKDHFLEFLSMNPKAFLPLFQTLASRLKEDLETENGRVIMYQRAVDILYLWRSKSVPLTLSFLS